MIYRMYPGHIQGARALPVALALAMLALPAAAAEFRAPAGCTLEYTVQSRGCSVGQYYRCDADPDGWQRVSIFDEQGLRHLSTIDAETRWIESVNPVNGIMDQLEPAAENDASFSTLIETGRDDFDFWTLSNTGERLRHVGYDVLTGEKVTIDGVELELTRFELTTTNSLGDVLIERTGQQFINRSFNRFFGGIETSTDWTGENRETDDSPVTFAFPGEAGFGSTQPEYDCGMQMAMVDALIAPGSRP